MGGQPQQQVLAAHAAPVAAHLLKVRKGVDRDCQRNTLSGAAVSIGAAGAMADVHKQVCLPAYRPRLCPAPAAPYNTLPLLHMQPPSRPAGCRAARPPCPAGWRCKGGKGARGQGGKRERHHHAPRSQGAVGMEAVPSLAHSLAVALCNSPKHPIAGAKQCSQDAIGLQAVCHVQQAGQRVQLRSQLVAPVGGIQQHVLCSRQKGA